MGVMENMVRKAIWNCITGTLERLVKDFRHYVSAEYN